MKRKSTSSQTPPPSLRRLGARQRRPVLVTNLTGLTHQLALARSAASKDTARHRDDLVTMSQAYQVLYAEYVELKAQSEGAAHLATERIYRLQAEVEAAEVRADQLQHERDASMKIAREAREAGAKMAGQLAAASTQISDLLNRIGVPPPKASSRAPVPPARVPLVPRVITTPRGAKKRAGLP